MKNKAIKRFLFFFILFFSLNAYGKVNEIDTYYVRLDVQSVNNIYEKANFFMMPIEDDFRAKEFRQYRIFGIADRKRNIAIDDKTSARNNAISTLLEKEGLKSLKSENQIINSKQSNAVIISYEGIIKIPYGIIMEGYQANGSYAVDFNILFSPISFQDEWKELYYQHKIKKFFKNITDGFKEMLN